MRRGMQKANELYEIYAQFKYELDEAKVFCMNVRTMQRIIA